MTYDDAFGVCCLEWHLGSPEADGRLVLCEVWRSEIGLDWHEPRKPHIAVHTQVEMRTYGDGKWLILSYGGKMQEPRPGSVRRHAYLPTNHWHSTITIDKWEP